MAPVTVGGVVADLTARFATAAIESARLDARVLVGHVLGVAPAQLFARADDDVGAEALAKIAGMAARRLRHEPVSRIKGVREFWGLDFELGAATLDPRPDTETLVEAALGLREKFSAVPSVDILDLGTGTGCILLAVLSEWPVARGLGIDISADAVATATGNAHRLGLSARAHFETYDWRTGLTGPVSLVVSNPPYISDRDFELLAPEVANFDPSVALRGGGDGLDAYRALLPQVRGILVAGGWALFEVGAGQADDVAALAVSAGMAPAAVHCDLAGVARVVALRRPED